MTTLLILARAIYFGSGMVLVCVVAFRWLVLRPGLAEADFQEEVRRFVFLVKGAALVLVLSGVALFWITTAIMSDESLLEAPSEFSTVLFQSGFGTVSLVRAGFAVLLLVGISGSGFFGEVIGALAAAGFVLSNAWIGHVAAVPGRFGGWRIATDALHLLGAVVWPTGLLFFGLFLAEARRRRLDSRVITAVACRFSRVSLFAVIALTLTGVINACAVLGSFSALVMTAYGRLLGLKLFFFALMIGFAAWNRFRLLPVLTANRPQPVAESLLSQLRNFVWVELGLGIAIVIIVAVLGVMPP